MANNRINKLLRIIINKQNKKRLKAKEDFSVISSNCYGAIILHDLGLQFNSPFVNLWVKPKDFIKYLKNIEYYNSLEMKFKKEKNIDYPIGVLDDIKINFQHYSTEKEAKEKWESRKRRINYEKLFIMFTDRDGCTYEDLKEFDSLPYDNKVVFTNKEYPDIKSCFYIKGFENEKCVGHCYEFISPLSNKRYLDQFDYVEWFNKQ